MTESEELPSCPICLESLEASSTKGKTVTTKCKHVFHLSCLHEFIAHCKKERPTKLVQCPLCQRTIVEIYPASIESTCTPRSCSIC